MRILVKNNGVTFKNVLLVLPTLNPGKTFDAWIDAFNKLNIWPGLVSVVDSSSTDGTQDKVKESGFALTVINKEDFNHGATRRRAVENNINYEFIVFMTQDAFFYSVDSLGNLLRAFDDDKVAAICGRQLPSDTSGAVERHARLFNYPSKSFVRMYEDRDKYGLKTAFLSNSFAAYRSEALMSVGGFPDDVIFGEDMYVAAKLLQSGWKIAYASEACVVHSHNYTLIQEFKRYFDMGVFHSMEPWLRHEFGSAEREGKRFVISEIRYLLKNAFWRIPEGLFRTVLRYLGFRLGLLENRLPGMIKRKLSMNSGFFRHKT